MQDIRCQLMPRKERKWETLLVLDVLVLNGIQLPDLLSNSL